MLSAVLVASGLVAEARYVSAREISTPAPKAGFYHPSALSVRFQNSLLSIEAKRQPLTEVLGEIQRKTGIRFHYTARLDRKITLSLKAQPIQQALENLLGLEANFIMHLQAPAVRTASALIPQEVRILSVSRGSGPAEPDLHIGSLELTGSQSRSPIDSTSDDQTEGQPALVDDELGRQEAVERLIEMAQNDNPALRVEGLSALADAKEADQSTIRYSLNAALADVDPSVRGYAALALYKLGGIEAIEYLSNALHDPEPTVRLMVVQSLSPKDRGIALLQEALSDEDETIRSVARSALKRSGSL